MYIYKTKTYRYAAPFPGAVPGLPQELTGAEAEELGVKDLLKEALEIGTYQEVEEDDEE